VNGITRWGIGVVGDGVETVTALLLHSAGRDESMTHISFMDLVGALDLGSQEPAPLTQMPDFKEDDHAFVEKRSVKFNRS
jgi:hypothetical protein